MRVYILSNAYLKKNILHKLEPYFYKERQICYIWSIGGLLHVENDKIYKVKIQDILSKKTLLGAFPVTIDESEFIRKEECYQIEPRSYKEYTTIKVYHLVPAQASAHVEWILEYKDNELYDNYFSLPAGEDIHSPKNKADILQFLNI